MVLEPETHVFLVEESERASGGLCRRAAALLPGVRRFFQIEVFWSGGRDAVLMLVDNIIEVCSISLHKYISVILHAISTKKCVGTTFTASDLSPFLLSHAPLTCFSALFIPSNVLFPGEKAG